MHRWYAPGTGRWISEDPIELHYAVATTTQIEKEGTFADIEQNYGNGAQTISEPPIIVHDQSDVRGGGCLRFRDRRCKGSLCHIINETDSLH
jgi:hypothetical protein